VGKKSHEGELKNGMTSGNFLCYNPEIERPRMDNGRENNHITKIFTYPA
jgi:hypothetical protein